MRREVWHGRPVGAWGGTVVQDDDDVLVLYMPEGSPPPFRRSPLGFDTLDNVLDIVIAPDGTWRWKDEEELDGWVARGRFTRDEVAEIRAEGARVAAELDAGSRWWDETWATWKPDPAWPMPELPDGWDRM